MPTSCPSNLDQEFERLAAFCSPRLLAVANGPYGKVAKRKREFLWHSHAEEDEVFLVCKARLSIGYRERPPVVRAEGDFHGVPRGVAHITAAPEQCGVVLVEPAATQQTPDIEHELTTSIDRQLAQLRAPVQDTRQQETEAQWPSKS
jgi:mannose-6-phosphate isomerase-like protein (cupin superfamily)